LGDVEAAFNGRALGIDSAAATASTNGLTLVTRNDRNVADLGAMVFNPFKGAENHR